MRKLDSLPIATVIMLFLAALGIASGAGAETLSAGNTSPEKYIRHASFVVRWQAPVSKVDGSGISMHELAGYRIYVGHRRDEMNPVVDVNDPYAMEYRFSNLGPGDYWVGVTAYRPDGGESHLSKLVRVRILPG